MPESRERPEDVVMDNKELNKRVDEFVLGVNTNFAQGITLNDFQKYLALLKVRDRLEAEQLIANVGKLKKDGEAIDPLTLRQHGWRFDTFVNDGSLIPDKETE